MQVSKSHQVIAFTDAAFRSIDVYLDGNEAGDAGVLHLMKAEWRSLKEVHLCTNITK